MSSLDLKNQFELYKTNNSLDSNLGEWRGLNLLPQPPVGFVVIIQTR